MNLVGPAFAKASAGQATDERPTDYGPTMLHIPILRQGQPYKSLDVVTVLTGGWTRRDRTDAGAVAVYDDVAELLANLDDSPLARLLK